MDVLRREPGTIRQRRRHLRLGRVAHPQRLRLHLLLRRLLSGTHLLSRRQPIPDQPEVVLHRRGEALEILGGHVVADDLPPDLDVVPRRRHPPRHLARRADAATRVSRVDEADPVGWGADLRSGVFGSKRLPKLLIASGPVCSRRTIRHAFAMWFS
jgi:hypothetical protein